MSIRPDRPHYDIRRREDRSNDGKPLKGFAIDLTLRISDGGNTIFLQDHNARETNQVMPFSSSAELIAFLDAELGRNWDEHYGKAGAS